MPHSIFIRAYAEDGWSPPEMIAYDIDSVTLANRLTRSIARAYERHGYDPATGRRWYQAGTRLYEIYRWHQ